MSRTEIIVILDRSGSLLAGAWQLIATVLEKQQFGADSQAKRMANLSQFLMYIDLRLIRSTQVTPTACGGASNKMAIGHRVESNGLLGQPQEEEAA